MKDELFCNVLYYKQDKINDKTFYKKGSKHSYYIAILKK